MQGLGFDIVAMLWALARRRRRGPRVERPYELGDPLVDTLHHHTLRHGPLHWHRHTAALRFHPLEWKRAHG